MSKNKKDSFGIMAEAIAKYMREQGWEVIALDKIRVQQHFADLKYNYDLVFRFTGKKISKPEGKDD